MTAKYVYDFGDGDKDMKALLGGKGANLAEMTRIGLPVPPGFTITTEVCTYYYDHGQTYPKQLEREVETSLVRLEALTGKRFGDRDNPLLVSVRSGARDSMPGMEARAPDRTDTSSGDLTSPNEAPTALPTSASAASTSALRPAGS